MQKSGKVKRVLILCGDIDGNIGDRAIAKAMCREFKRIAPSVQLVLVSKRPSPAAAYFGAAVIQKGLKGLLSQLRWSRRCDVILVGGGGLFQDDDSLVKMPYWGLRIALLRLLNPGKPIIGYSLGVGPLRNPLSKFFARMAFGCMSLVSVRDPAAKRTASSLTAKTVRLVPDPALLLPAAPESQALDRLNCHGVPLNDGPLIGVALRRWFHQSGSIIPHRYASKYRLRRIPGAADCDAMIALIADVLNKMVKRFNAYIVFLPTYNVAHEADDSISLRVIKQMEANRTMLIRIADPIEYKAIASRLDVLLGARMHPTIFAAACGTKVIGLSYNQKFQGFFELLGLQDKVIPLADFVRLKKSQWLYDHLAEAVEVKDDTRLRADKLAGKLKGYNEQVILPLLCDPE